VLGDRKWRGLTDGREGKEGWEERKREEKGALPTRQ